MDKSYLGDGVYAEHDAAHAIWLTTENGIEATNRICLELETLHALGTYAQRHGFAPVVGIVERDAMIIVAALVAKLGGEASLTDSEIRYAAEAELHRAEAPAVAPGLKVIKLRVRKRGA